MVEIVPRNQNRFARSRALFVLVTVVLLVPIATGTLRRAAAQAEDQNDSFYKELAVFTEVLSLIRRGYVEETGLAGLFAGALDGTADGLDPLATYVPGDRVDAYRTAEQRSVVRSGLHLVRDRGILYVVGVATGSAGEAAGFKSGDILSKLSGDETRLQPLWNVQLILAQDEGTTLAIEVLRQGQTLELELTLADHEPAAPAIEFREEVPVLRISNFAPNLLQVLESSLREPSLVTDGPLVIDVRGVAGGDLEAAARAASLFVRGDLGGLKARDEAVASFESEYTPMWAGSLIVLTNRGSQGASEVFASLLQHLGGAQLVGEGTFGHAGRRSILELSDGAELHYTDAYYVGPDGTALTESLPPDIRVADVGRRSANTADSANADAADEPAGDLILEKAIGLALESSSELKKAA